MHQVADSEVRSRSSPPAHDPLGPATDASHIEFELRDGSVCRIRPIHRGDRRRLEMAFEQLSPDSRRLRFFGVKKALTPAELDYLVSPDGQDHIAYGAVRLDAQGNELDGLGAARCIRVAPDSDTAEVAMAVVDAAQGEGIGGRLLRQLVTAARRRGIRRLRCDVLAENSAMRALAVSMGGELRRADENIVEYECPLPDSELGNDPLGLAMLYSAVQDTLELGFHLVDKTAESVTELLDSWTLREVCAPLQATGSIPSRSMPPKPSPLLARAQRSSRRHPRPSISPA